MANSITLSKATIKAISDYGRNVSVENRITCLEDEMFTQDGCTVFVDYRIFAEIRTQEIVHTEVPQPDVEVEYYWGPVYIEIRNIRAYSPEGEEIEITNADKLEDI